MKLSEGALVLLLWLLVITWVCRGVDLCLVIGKEIGFREALWFAGFGCFMWCVGSFLTFKRMKVSE